MRNFKKFLNFNIAIICLIAVSFTLQQIPVSIAQESEELTIEEKPESKAEKKITKKIPTGEIVVTDVKLIGKGASKKAEIVINDLIKIREIGVKKVGKRTVLKFPVYISKSGRIYPQVKVLTKAANDAIVKAIETGKASKPEGLPKEMKYEITKFSPFKRPGSSLRVSAAVTFNDAIEIECKIMEGISKRSGKPYKFVSWPSRKEEGSNEWVKQVSIRSKFKEKLDNALLEKYEIWKKEGLDEFE